MSKEKKPQENYQYDPKRRRLAKIYSKQKFIMGVANRIVIPLLTVLILYFSGMLQGLASWSLATGGTIGGIVIFIAIINILSTLIEFPISLYSSFFYEHKYGLSKQTFGAWLKDYGKELLVGYSLGIPIEVLTAWLAITTPLWWLYAAGVGIVFGLFIEFIYPIVILPFLHKLTPYTDKKELKNLFAIIKRAGAAELKRIKILKESERSTKVNAMFTGIGSVKTVVLYDNLINKFTKREVRTVIAHELGHYVHNHVPKSFVFESIKSLLVLFVADRIIRNMFDISTTTGLPLFSVVILSAVISILGIVLLPISMAYSRKHEYQADWFAIEQTKDPVANISTERRLADLDLGDENPHPFIEFWFHSHPSTEKRIAAYKQWMKINNIKA